MRGTSYTRTRELERASKTQTRPVESMGSIFDFAVVFMRKYLLTEDGMVPLSGFLRAFGCGAIAEDVFGRAAIGDAVS